MTVHHARHPLKHAHHAHHPAHHAHHRHHHAHHHAAAAHHADSFSGGKVSGTVASWIDQAKAILRAHGVPESKMNSRDLAMIIQHESGGNPNAQNNWDSNARAGHPSIGLMQTIGPTFNAHKLPGHGNIRNPVDNIIAGVRYAIARYGSISNVPGVRAVHQGGRYRGY